MFFFFNDTATTEIYTLSLHDALPICRRLIDRLDAAIGRGDALALLLIDLDGFKELNDTLGHHAGDEVLRDRKSTRLNSSHANISYAVFCLKKKLSYTSSLTHLLPLPS